MGEWGVIFEEAIDRFVLFLATERGLSDNYQLSTRQSLEAFAAWAGLKSVREAGEVTTDGMTAYLLERRAGGLANATGPALNVQQSNDGVNWTTVGSIPAFDGATAFDLKSGDRTDVTQRFARVVLTGASGSAAIVNISAQPYRA